MKEIDNSNFTDKKWPKIKKDLEMHRNKWKKAQEKSDKMLKMNLKRESNHLHQKYRRKDNQEMIQMKD